jgi:beta-alanine--pyruvate transaminase
MPRKGFYVRYGADTIQLAPPFVATPQDINPLLAAPGETLMQTD